MLMLLRYSKWFLPLVAAIGLFFQINDLIEGSSAPWGAGKSYMENQFQEQDIIQLKYAKVMANNENYEVALYFLRSPGDFVKLTKPDGREWAVDSDRYLKINYLGTYVFYFIIIAAGGIWALIDYRRNRKTA